MKLKAPKHLQRRNGRVDDLAASLRRHGQLQPIIARPDGEVIIGERRRRILGERATVIVKEVSEIEAVEMRLSEDMSKTDIDPVERGEAIANLKRLLEKNGETVTNEALAKRIGTTPGTVRYYLSFARLPGAVKEMVQEGRLEHKVAERLATPRLTAKEQTTIAKKVVKGLVPGGMAIGEVVRYATQEAPAEIRKHITEHPRTSFEEARRAADRRRAAADRARDAGAAAVRIEHFFLTFKRKIRDWASGLAAVTDLAPSVPESLHDDVARAVRQLRDRCDRFLVVMEEGKALPVREAHRAVERATKIIDVDAQ